MTTVDPRSVLSQMREDFLKIDDGDVLRCIRALEAVMEFLDGAAIENCIEMCYHADVPDDLRCETPECAAESVKHRLREAIARELESER